MKKEQREKLARVLDAQTAVMVAAASLAIARIDGDDELALLAIVEQLTNNQAAFVERCSEFVDAD